MKRLTIRDESGYYHLRRGPKGGEINKITVVQHLGRLEDIALRHQIWEEQLWHDAKTDPPKTPGLYYGKKDDTNSMYPCLYRDGIWVLSAYQQTKMDIVQRADYTAFVRGDD